MPRDSKPRKTILHIGGVMRCCSGTLNEHLQTKHDCAKGEILPCAYCKSSLILKMDGWHWNEAAESWNKTPIGEAADAKG